MSIRTSLLTEAKRVKRGLNQLQQRIARKGRSVLLVVARDVKSEKTQRILARLRFFVPATTNITFRVVTRASLPAVLSARAVAEVDSGVLPRGYRRVLQHTFDVDFENNPLDAWRLADLASFLADAPSASLIQDAHQRLCTAFAKIRARGIRRAYLFGTGPSLSNAISRDFSDGAVIVCNTIVRDEELWRHLRPDIVTAADALYHFGHTAHARAFRADLRARLLDSGGSTVFAYPIAFDAVVRREFQDLTDLLIPIPFGSDVRLDVDLCESFYLPPLGNVLNAMLLPLGCSLSRSVWLWGFDGRAPSDAYFWSNSSKHSYPDLMPELRSEHPAFFGHFVPPTKEQSYVDSVHGDELEVRLQAAERAGFEFRMMHPSWTKTLGRRVLPGIASTPTSAP